MQKGVCMNRTRLPMCFISGGSKVARAADENGHEADDCTDDWEHRIHEVMQERKDMKGS